ncbi:MAG: TonB-dependent receptor plug domain-containing protein, partial [Phycisphaeraceae bacterium]|nr:TonB-dependent receptor plug domain-containing protein [Phycisphaeraceae bacterium]
LLVVAGSPAGAQETTGGLQGNVGDGVGAPIAGAVVEASGPLGRVATASDEDGRYRFPRLAPGTYTVAASFEGLPRVEAEAVRVILGEAVTVDFTLQRGVFEEEIQVYSDTVSIDFTESQTATSIHQWEIDHLPRGRDFTDVVTYAPGTVLNHQGGGIMIDGASGLENRYIIDGIDTTDPQRGQSSVPMRAEMMEEVQIKSAGYMAEFGGSLGGVINAVTRSGSNEFHGSLFVDIEDNDWNGSARSEIERLEDGAQLVTYDKDDEKRYDPGFTLGGPI